ncbi:thioredoxin [Candidatus Comchoanobacter bicostacola]|uniref:Thioredoxin n=1 Tax=Candidatus Comchoanobacter bicostacola TaxID=2919598 RepID=A0ABY5DJ65_9GAMM|nr:thioredoxin [Candidatus Comchoanobacter bicostacola]UTC24601.1 thioredoxin [Candidatus Comchoanobacter bicostacola]
MNTIHTTDQSFQKDVLEASKPVLVDFWADWCPPCKRISPILDEIANEITDISVCKIDIVANPECMRTYDVKGLPTLLFFVNGSIVGRKVGALSKAQILDFITQSTTQSQQSE